MEGSARNGRRSLNLASRKAEESAWRRFQAAHWLDSLVGPIGLSSQPTEKEFISCLRNGLVLCNAVNKMNPGSVPKVVEVQSSSQDSMTWDSQPLLAYQYFENVKNFLVAVEELKLPAFEVSDLERENLEVGSSTKIVDCVLSLKAYHEWKQNSGGNGVFRNPKSPSVMHYSRSSGTINHSNSSRQLDLSEAVSNKNMNLQDLITKYIVDCIAEKKENIDDKLLLSFHDKDSVKLLGKIMSGFLEEHHLQSESTELKVAALTDSLEVGGGAHARSLSVPLDSSSFGNNKECCRNGSRKGGCSHGHIVENQERELLNLKTLLVKTKSDFADLQSQLQQDLKLIGSHVQELSTAASGYHRVLMENKKLYNTVQDLKGNIRVYCRIRPIFSAEAKNVIDFIGDDGSLVIVDQLKPQKDGKKIFQFNRVFGPISTQEEVFNDTQPLIRSVMDGYNVCIFAYGQTGSGKTHTMSGPSGGINYLALRDLFHLANNRSERMNYNIHVQMVEIYNEQIRDLLLPEDSSSNIKLEIRNCGSENGPSLPDAIMYQVNSTEDVLKLMKLGEINRAVSSTAVNHQSSRSHSIVTVHVNGKDRNGGGILHSCLHLVDLAGSERVDKSEVTGDELKEAQHINKSLSCLGDVIAALAQKNSYIPYRNSKLTHLLQSSLGGHAKTLMFAHISPEGDSFWETMGTLKFAQRVSTVELGKAQVNKETREVIELKEQIGNLKKALAMKEANEVPRSSPLKRQPQPDLTPPRLRRLSIENGKGMKAATTSYSAVKRSSKTPSVQKQRPRRLSLEHLNKDTMSISNNSSLLVKTPESRNISSAARSRTPPPPPLSQQQQTRKLNQSPSPPRKENNQSSKATSQIKKSLRTIGKLINGSDKRNQTRTPTIEVLSPLNGNRRIPDVKSPLSTTTGGLRRRSLVGDNPQQLDNSIIRSRK
ncbi:kinesin-like protein KIN-14L [Impatiens glandulifera]|uniref:kinesin-like protein KIN-14L n=1 Tax=Impatiens glandulifera TaxID=253017 RepID=UPI001FB13B19|nr:kinesin-like protein KIN-14L [Impatiens glandulifera]XP_047333469.1 kinesin-like protein KIN-14L [Impatiens glandulifera]XP_047333470.1 kinesin-like protein KIN-14L [Impatiens glandulifera]